MYKALNQVLIDIPGQNCTTFFFCKTAPGYFYREINGNVFSMICSCFYERNVTVFWNKIEFSIHLVTHTQRTTAAQTVYETD